MSDGQAQQRSVRQSAREWRWAALNARRHDVANESLRAIPDQRAGQETRLAENLEAVAGAHDEFASCGLLHHCAHDRRETRDRAAPQVIAIREAAWQDDRVEAFQRMFLVP